MVVPRSLRVKPWKRFPADGISIPREIVKMDADEKPDSGERPASLVRTCGRFLLGRPLANRETRERQIGVIEGMPAMGLDALSFSAYGPEAALTMLAVGSERKL
jgi:hypothetical protein